MNDALLDIIRAAVVNVAERSPGLRGPFVFDEAELQAAADKIRASLPVPVQGGEGELVKRLLVRADHKNDWNELRTVDKALLREAAARLEAARAETIERPTALTIEFSRWRNHYAETAQESDLFDRIVAALTDPLPAHETNAS